MTRLTFEVVVLGDEVESILTAVSAARQGASVVLVRSSTGKLGGLSTRGALSYMDITPEYTSPLFREFLDKAGVVRVALEAERAHQTLLSLLAEAGVTVLDGVQSIEWISNPTGSLTGIVLNEQSVLHGTCYIDATPDADWARAAGVPYLSGLGGVLGEDQNFLGVSPVFRIAGTSREAMMEFEARLRANPDLPQLLESALPFHPPELRAEYITRPCFSPPEMDYLDILNPVIGIAYHLWRHGEVTSYPTATTWIDGGNVSLLSDGTMGFNGLVSRYVLDLDDPLSELLRLSHGGGTPAFLLEEMNQFERFLHAEGGMDTVKILTPEALYVRQTVTLLARNNMTAEQTIRGGVSPEDAIGTFSYWLDLRGTQLWKLYPGEELPKPVFNVGLQVAFPKDSRLENLAFVSRSAGYSPIGQGTGRIVQHNAMLGEAIGIAAAMAVQTGRPMHQVPPNEIREVLGQRQGSPIVISGHPTWSEEALRKSKLLQADRLALKDFVLTI